MKLDSAQLKQLAALADQWQAADAAARDALRQDAQSQGNVFAQAFAAMVQQLDAEDTSTGLPRIPAAMRDAALAASFAEKPSVPDETPEMAAFGVREARARPTDISPLDGDAAVPPKRRPGQRVGPYRLIRELGRGGMGVVWLAERADGQHARQVALKMPLLENLNWLLAARFARERNILASLEHPGIARFYEAGVDDADRSAQPFIAIEYVQGQPITTYVKDKRLRPEATVQLFTGVIEAVAHAHAQLIIHRDIKPSNVLVDAKGDTHLLDFGIAKLLDDDEVAADATQLTRLSGRALTLDYASPEQVNNTTLGTASDVYSLGVLLYELLTGSRPYRPKGPTRHDLEEAILEQDPAKPSDQILTTGDSESGKSARRMRGDLDTIVLKALRKDPKQRYATAQAFADDLRRYLAYEVIAAKPDDAWYRMGRFVRRHRMAASAAFISVAALVTGLSVALWQRDIAQHQAMRADAERSRAVSELTYAEVINDFTSFLLSTGSARPYTTAELLTRAEKLVIGQYPDDASLRARLQVMIAQELMRLGEFQRSENLLNQAANGLASTAQTDASLALVVDCAKGLLYAFDTRQGESRRLLDATIDRLAAMPSADPSALGYCLNARGRLHFEQQDHESSRRDIDRAIEILGTPRPGQRSMLLNLHERLASTLSQAGRHSDAEQAHRTALAILQKSNREESAQGANLWNGLGTSRVLAGDWLGARVAFEKSFHISESLQTQANLYIASNYAEALAETGDYASAFAIFEPTLARAIEKKESASAAVLALRAGYAYCGLGQRARCKAMVDIASEHLPRGYPATDYLFARLDLLRSAAATVAGNPADALTYARRAHDGFIARGAPLVVRFRGAGYLATLAAKQGDVALAREALASIASLREQMMAVPKSNAFLGEVLLADATVQMTEGRGQAARPTLVLARDHLLGGAGASALSTRRAAHMLLVD